MGTNLRRAIVTIEDFTAYVCDMPQPSELRFGVVRAVGRGIVVGLLDGGPRHARAGGKVLGVCVPHFHNRNAIGSPTVKCFRFVCENLTMFPFGKRIIGKLDSWAFLAI